MEKKQKVYCLTAAIFLCLFAILGHYVYDPWSFYWKVPEAEAALRISFVNAAEDFLGCNEADGSHEAIIDLYNAHEPLAQGYTVQYTDSWCSTFVSAVSIQCDLTRIIPTECGCQRHIGLFQELECWEEDDNAIPLPGDLVFYDWDADHRGESQGWSDHVGIVVGTKWPFIKVIEGNKDDQVAYRIIPIGHKSIRGFAKPDYATLLKDPR